MLHIVYIPTPNSFAEVVGASHQASITKPIYLRQPEVTPKLSENKVVKFASPPPKPDGQLTSTYRISVKKNTHCFSVSNRSHGEFGVGEDQMRNTKTQKGNRCMHE